MMLSMNSMAGNFLEKGYTNRCTLRLLSWRSRYCHYLYLLFLIRVIVEHSRGASSGYSSRRSYGGGGGGGGGGGYGGGGGGGRYGGRG